MCTLTRAEAWCWVAWLHAQESDSLLYQHPRTEQDELEATRLRAMADSFHDAAVVLDGDPGLWRRALDKWDGKVSDGGK